jgi:tRNA dimethylallyltransferase
MLSARNGPRPVLIAGPTAGGKSELALRLAVRDGGCIINADAAQVYACWRVLTARPDERDARRVPHRLYGHVPCDRGYSVGAWLRDLAPLLDGLARERRRAIIVGGTGLYMTALTEGLAEIPPIPAEVRARSAAILATGDLERLRRDLSERDPETLAGIDASNPMRLQRAWEVLSATGRGLSQWQQASAPPLLAPDRYERVLLWPDSASTTSAIANRFEKMIEAGALDECRAFLRSGGRRASPAGRVLGAPQLIAHLDGACSLPEAIDAAVAASRRFAKRQRTWFRGRLADWRRLDPAVADPLPHIAPHRGAGTAVRGGSQIDR